MNKKELQRSRDASITVDRTGIIVEWLPNTTGIRAVGVTLEHDKEIIRQSIPLDPFNFDNNELVATAITCRGIFSRAPFHQLKEMSSESRLELVLNEDPDLLPQESIRTATMGNRGNSRKLAYLTLGEGPLSDVILGEKARLFTAGGIDISEIVKTMLGGNKVNSLLEDPSTLLNRVSQRIEIALLFSDKSEVQIYDEHKDDLAIAFGKGARTDPCIELRANLSVDDKDVVFPDFSLKKRGGLSEQKYVLANAMDKINHPTAKLAIACNYVRDSGAKRVNYFDLFWTWFVTRLVSLHQGRLLRLHRAGDGDPWMVEVIPDIGAACKKDGSLGKYLGHRLNKKI